MTENAFQSDPAFSVMTLDILTSVLSRAGNPAEMGRYLGEEVRGLTGARCAVFLEFRETGGEGACRVASVNPEHRRGWAESPAVFRLYEEARRLPAAAVWRPGDASETGRLLEQEGLPLSLIVPLKAGPVCVGALLALGLPDDTHMESQLNLLNTLSTIVALVFRNAVLYEGQESLVRARTRELEMANAALRQSEAEARGLLQAADHSRRALLDTLEDQGQAEEELRRLNTQLATAEVVARVGSWERSVASDLAAWSANMYQIFEVDPAEQEPLVFSNFVQTLVHPEDRERILRSMQAALAGHGPYEMEYRVRLRSGAEKIIHARGEMERDAAGKPFRLLGIVQDVTERRKAEAARRESEERFAQVAVQAKEWIWEVNAEGLYTYASPVIRETLGYAPEELVGKKYFYDLFHPDERESLKTAAFEVFARRETFSDFLNRNVHKDGHTVWLSTSGLPMVDPEGRLAGYRGTDLDITAYKRAEDGLRRSQQQLRALSARMETLREAERARISREIHDELGQMLTGIKMDLRWMERRLDEFSGDRRLNPIVDKLATTTELTDAMVKTVQRIAAELRPGILDKLGLPMALQYEAGRFEERTGIVCRLVTPEEAPTLQPEAATAFFRILQEALTNVFRHAQATAVEVTLEVEAEGCRLEIRDNGRGFGNAEQDKPTSLGLLGMRERAGLLGGDVYFANRHGGGGVVTVWIPSFSGGQLCL